MADPSSYPRPEPRILVADADPTVRSALRLVLSQAFGLHTLAEAADADDLRGAAALGAPDLVLLDWSLPGLRADADLAALRAWAPAAVVLIFSTRPDPRAAVLAAGADAFVCKADDPSLLLALLQRLLPLTPPRPT